VISKSTGNKDEIVPGLMAVGEAACVSVHGANRLGSNSLIDLVVFGKAAAVRAASILKKNMPHEKIPESETQKSIDRFDKLRNAKGSTPTSKLRDKMQRTMQSKCAVFRDDKILKEGMKEIQQAWKGLDDISVSDRSLIFNTDLVETLEFDNLIRQSLVTVASAENRKESRGAHFREDFKERDDEKWMKHTLAWHNGNGVKIDYRNVHNFTLTSDVQYFPPKARVY